MNFAARQTAALLVVGIMLLMTDVPNGQGRVLAATQGIEKQPIPTEEVVITQLNADVTGDGVADSVVLVGRRTPLGGAYVTQLNVLVVDGASKEQVHTDLAKFGGYNAKLFAGDFDGDKVDDIMISAPTGGSGGIVGTRIVSFANLVPKVIFNSDNNQGTIFTGEYRDGYQVMLVNRDTNINLLLDESARSAMYQQTGIYDSDGKLLQPRTPFIDPFGRLDPVDVDCDGTYELKGIQRISGAYHADGIANVQSVWKVGPDGWILQRLELTPLPRTGDEPILLYNHGNPDNCINQPENVTI